MSKKNKKYTVRLWREIRETAEIEVVASSPENAIERATDESGLDDSMWMFDSTLDGGGSASRCLDDL